MLRPRSVTMTTVFASMMAMAATRHGRPGDRRADLGISVQSRDLFILYYA
jgi:hypothetical protein